MAAKRYDSFWARNGLSIVVLACMLASLAGQVITGHRVYNQELLKLGALPMTFGAYLTTGHFVSATFENWESEFLQMGMYVLLSVSLRQKGSAESRPMSPSQETERIEKGQKPWPVRAGGRWKALYAHSLSTAFFVLFLVSFALHLAGSWRRENVERVHEGDSPISLMAYGQTSQFWFESFQNWQSEFLAVGALVLVSIWLRQKDSPQSKPVDAPHSQTGT
ncbi:MAG: DUF6766 family protein [Luteimonas sp.]